jgi:hypothetical protein
MSCERDRNSHSPHGERFQEEGRKQKGNRFLGVTYMPHSGLTNILTSSGSRGADRVSFRDESNKGEGFRKRGSNQTLGSWVLRGRTEKRMRKWACADFHSLLYNSLLISKGIPRFPMGTFQPITSLENPTSPAAGCTRPSTLTLRWGAAHALTGT